MEARTEIVHGREEAEMFRSLYISEQTPEMVDTPCLILKYPGNALYLGTAHPSSAELKERHIRAVVSVLDDHLAERNPISRGDFLRFVIPIADTEQTQHPLNAAADSIHRALQHGNTYVHCWAGISRSATAVLAYLMKYLDMTMMQAYLFVKRCRPIIHPNRGFLQQLRRFEQKLRGRRVSISE